MKLLYVLGSFYPAQKGGPNNTIYWSAKELVRRGADVSVAALKDGLSPEHISQHGIFLGSETRLNGIRAWYFDYSLSRYFSFAMFRWLILNIKQYDMVNLTSIFFAWTWFAALLCIIYRVPFSIAPRGELEPGAYCFSKKRKDFISYLFLKRLLARARFVLVTSTQEKNYSRNYFPKKMIFENVPNYIDIEVKSFRPKSIYNKRNILYLGRIHPKKGIENLINAFNLLDYKILDDHRLLIVGTGDKRYMDSLKKQAANSERAGAINFLGHRAGNEKKLIYSEAKVMVLPSYSENFGNVVVEALAHATPVIASKYTPWSDLKKVGCGNWVENDPESISQALELILSLSQEDYNSMAEAARRFVIETYDIRQNGGKLEKLYRSHL